MTMTPIEEHRTEMTAQTTDTDAAYRDELAQLRERVRNPSSDDDRRDAFRRIAAIDREMHADTYAKLARE
jgi:hypothetical protein